ncbi:MAG: hypothetical protein JEY94_11610 [Melioribacteraceae bacterium]|nr:hypothetical protein [Melioribacteraceae bacterium]
MKKTIAAFVTGFGAGVLKIVPIIKGLSCCLVIPAAAFFALLLDQKANNNYAKIRVSKAILFGLLTGLFAAVFGTSLDLIITYITKSNEVVTNLPQIQEMLGGMPANSIVKEVIDIYAQIAKDITATGFSGLYAVFIFGGSLLTDPIFGMVGGLIGMQILNSKNIEKK